MVNTHRVGNMMSFNHLWSHSETFKVFALLLLSNRSATKQDQLFAKSKDSKEHTYLNPVERKALFISTMDTPERFFGGSSPGSRDRCGKQAANKAKSDRGPLHGIGVL